MLATDGSYLYPMRTFAVTLPDAASTQVLGVGDTQVEANACWRVTIYATDGAFQGEAMVFRRQGTSSTRLMTLAESGVTFSLSGNALHATQATGSSILTRVISQRMA